jgi:ABC-2 type transport system ATP-binding protein
VFAVRCSGLFKSYGEVKAVDGLDLVVGIGECFGLLGPNGAGKTTTIEILEGLTKPDAGDLEILTDRWEGGDDHGLRERIGVQLQETRLPEKLTVLETVRLFASFYRAGQDCDRVIAAVELGEKRHARVGKLSGGQRQRLALACALVGDPELLFLDEPTTGLDPQGRLRVWEVIESFRKHGGTVILTTHYMEEAARLCDRVAIMDHGRIIALGTPNELVASLHADQILELQTVAPLPLDRLEALPGVASATLDGRLSRLNVRDVAATLPALVSVIAAAGTELESLTTHQPTLEDVFVRLTGRALREN